LPNLPGDLVTKTDTPIACWVSDPIHASCTSCIVGVSRALGGRPLRSSDLSIVHPAVLPFGPSGGSRTQEKPYSKVQSPLSSSPPPAHSFVLGTAVIINNKHAFQDLSPDAQPGLQSSADNLSSREFRQAGNSIWFNITFNTVSPKETSGPLLPVCCRNSGDDKLSAHDCTM
jgi:hypothetical protein